MLGAVILLIGFSGITVFLGWQIYTAGRRRERLEQMERDKRTEELIVSKRDELSTVSDDELDERLRRWQ